MTWWAPNGFTGYVSRRAIALAFDSLARALCRLEDHSQGFCVCLLYEPAMIARNPYHPHFSEDTPGLDELTKFLSRVSVPDDCCVYVLIPDEKTTEPEFDGAFFAVCVTGDGGYGRRDSFRVAFRSGLAAKAEKTRGRPPPGCVRRALAFAEKAMEAYEPLSDKLVKDWDEKALSTAREEFPGDDVCVSGASEPFFIWEIPGSSVSNVKFGCLFDSEITVNGEIGRFTSCVHVSTNPNPLFDYLERSAR